jgi:hypothetical protein
MATYATLADRLAANSAANDKGCRVWNGNVNNSGYARFSVRVMGKVRKVYAHRAAYELLHGSVPAGMELDHVCVNARCINPAHLEPVTGTENLRRAAARRAA